jgi:hypothetical protein
VCCVLSRQTRRIIFDAKSLDNVRHVECICMRPLRSSQDAGRHLPFVTCLPDFPGSLCVRHANCFRTAYRRLLLDYRPVLLSCSPSHVAGQSFALPCPDLVRWPNAGSQLAAFARAPSPRRERTIWDGQGRGELEPLGFRRCSTSRTGQTRNCGDDSTDVPSGNSYQRGDDIDATWSSSTQACAARAPDAPASLQQPLYV